MEFKASLADPDVWMKPVVKTTGQTYFEYKFVYVDDILVCSTNPAAVIETLGKAYHLKEGSIGLPTQYLGAQIKPHHFEDMPANQFWSMSSHKYVKDAVRNLELDLKKIGKKLPSGRITTPLQYGYCPELDVSPLLDAEHTTFYQQLIGIL